MIEEITGLSEEFSRAQRWNHFLTLLAAAIMLLYGLNLRNNTLSATTSYSDPEAGIRVNYPSNWLLDDTGDYVLRVRDTSRVGFKTTIQVAIRPVGQMTSERNIRDQLIIERTDVLIGYQSYTTEPYVLPDETTGILTEYTFVDADVNPFSETLLNPVRGTDIITIRGGQALTITFQADSRTYAEDVANFERFLSSLELF